MAETRYWVNNIVGHADVDPRTLTAHPLNPKIHTVEQDAVVEASLQRLGWLKRVIQNQTTGHILDGHERIELAVRRGEPTVPVDYVTIPAEDEATALRTLDPSGQLAKTHLERWAALHQQGPEPEPVLRAFFGKLAQEYGVATEDGAAAPERVERRAAWAEAREAEEAALAEQAAGLMRTWGVALGDLWQLGAHRVLCGDSVDAAAVGRLVHGQAVDLVVTSPPYAVAKGYEQGGDIAAHRALLRGVGARCQAVVRPGGFVVMNFGEIWAQVMARAWTRSERACIYPMSTEYWQCYRQELGWELYAQRVWVKPFAKLRQPLWTYHTSLAHQQEWEHIWTWRLPGGDGEQVYEWDVSVHAVWDSGKEWLDRDGMGPWAHWSAGYPSFIPRQVLRAHSAKGQVVWEPFLGAGTTLLACEELGRTCLGSDRDPGAVAATLERYWQATGVRPERLA